MTWKDDLTSTTQLELLRPLTAPRRPRPLSTHRLISVQTPNSAGHTTLTLQVTRLLTLQVTPLFSYSMLSHLIPIKITHLRSELLYTIYYLDI